MSEHLERLQHSAGDRFDHRKDENTLKKREKKPKPQIPKQQQQKKSPKSEELLISQLCLTSNSNFYFTSTPPLGEEEMPRVGEAFSRGPEGMNQQFHGIGEMRLLRQPLQPLSSPSACT